MRSGCADGPAYITQCPIQTGQAYVYNFTVTGQRGTLWWHAHISWLRASVYGAFIIYPKRHVPYPFPKPYKEVPMILGRHDYMHHASDQTMFLINFSLFSGFRLINQWFLLYSYFIDCLSSFYIAGEWWNADTENVVNQAMQTGGGPNVSDCYTINGHPGPLYNCSAING